MDRAPRFIIREYLIENFSCRIPDGDLNDSESLLAAGVLDSIAVLGLVTFLEETFDLIVSDDEVLPENLDSVDNLVAFTERKLASSGGRLGDADRAFPGIECGEASG